MLIRKCVNRNLLYFNSKTVEIMHNAYASLSIWLLIYGHCLSSDFRPSYAITSAVGSTEYFKSSRLIFINSPVGLLQGKLLTETNNNKMYLIECSGLIYSNFEIKRLFQKAAGLLISALSVVHFGYEGTKNLCTVNYTSDDIYPSLQRL